MPRFVKNGPIIPDRLVQELEQDRVVLFCGAGISMGAGLPDFKGLVAHCLTELGAEIPPKKSADWLWLDRLLGDLEGRFDADSVRQRVVERLSQPSRDPSLHEAILRLAKLRKRDGLRLVTTNFDHYFENARAPIEAKLGVDFHSGPILPIPRNDIAGSWKSIVYLHGRLNLAGPNDHLVLTSADFGRAYLTDAWASRFVAKLFADFTVLFIGYSLNDPVLRYMTDAFAAENSSALNTPFGGPAYIFVSYKGRNPPSETPFTRRHLQPIFYHQYRHHSRLKKTLIAWADARDDFLADTTRLIQRIARGSPKTLNPSETSNLLWAVMGRDDLGHGARIFAGLAHRPSIEWLDEFERYEREAAELYSIASDEATARQRPLPVPPAQPIGSLFPDNRDDTAPQLSECASAFSDWMLRHLDNHEFVERVIAKLKLGRRLHPQLRARIGSKLIELPELKEGFRTFWRIVSSEGRWAVPTKHSGRFFELRSILQIGGDKRYASQVAMDFLEPALELKPSMYRLWAEDALKDTPPGERLAELADVEVILRGEEIVDLLAEVVKAHGGGSEFWAKCLFDLTDTLKRVLDLYAVADEADGEDDPSTYQRPSILPDEQNKYRESWARLVDFCWAGWSSVDETDPVASKFFIEAWRRIPYLTFRRLALAAATHSRHLSPMEKLEHLLDA